MFKILDGRQAFYQWDIDQRVVVEDRSITQVHYCNRTDDCALICECYELDGKWVADVPNVLLQDNWCIRVYAFDGCATKHEKRYDVIARSKPDTYVYTETEVLNYETIKAQMDRIDSNIDGVVRDYLEENPVKVDLTGYATEEFVNEKMAEVVVEEKEVYVGSAQPTDPAVKLWINPNADSSYATKKYVDDEIKTIELTPGPAGPQGPTGKPGKDGYTPIKGIDYFDGINGTNGKNGKDGKDGYTPVKGVDYFDGAPGTPGENGKDGADGYTPVKGVDYFDGKDGEDGKDYVLTDADKQEIAGMVEVPGADVDLSDYYTKEQIDNMLANLPAGDIPSGEGVKF